MLAKSYPYIKHFILHVIESINLHARGRKEKCLDSFLKYLQNF